MLLHEREIVIVTGAAHGIGRAIAIAYARNGAIVVLLDKEPKGLTETRKMITSIGRRAVVMLADISVESEVVEAIEDVYEQFGRIDILINNAGLGKTISLFDLKTEDWDYVINTNLRGTFLTSRESAKIMRFNGGGSIVNIASTRALMSESDTEAYSASKGGILALTHAMAMSLGPHKISVNAVSPGWIEVHEYEKLKPIDHSQHPSGRVGKPDDVALACIYLTSPENDFVTGTNIVVDGGMTRKMIYSE